MIGFDEFDVPSGSDCDVVDDGDRAAGSVIGSSASSLICRCT